MSNIDGKIICKQKKFTHTGRAMATWTKLPEAQYDCDIAACMYVHFSGPASASFVYMFVVCSHTKEYAYACMFIAGRSCYAHGEHAAAPE